MLRRPSSKGTPCQLTALAQRGRDCCWLAAASARRPPASRRVPVKPSLLRSAVPAVHTSPVKPSVLAAAPTLSMQDGLWSTATASFATDCTHLRVFLAYWRGVDAFVRGVWH